MSRAELETALKSYADAKNRHDLEAIVAAYAPDGLYESKCFPGRTQGHAALRKFYSDLFASLPDYYGSFDAVAYGQDSAVVWGRFGGTLSGTFMGLPVEAGRKLEIPVTFVCTFRDGLLLSDVGYYDAQTLLTQAGLGRNDEAEAAAAEDFVKRFKSFWAAPTGARSTELIHAGAKVHWPGVSMTGTELIAYFDNIFRALPGLKLEVVDHAHAGDRLYIFWRAEAPARGRTLCWSGVDRFVLKSGKAIEEHVNFDMGVVREALAATAEAA